MTNFIYFVAGFFFGAIVVDYLWAWKLGITTLVWSKITRSFNRVFRK